MSFTRKRRAECLSVNLDILVGRSVSKSGGQVMRDSERNKRTSEDLSIDMAAHVELERDGGQVRSGYTGTLIK